MQGNGSCCIARRATDAYDMAKVHRIMMGFRPIAPKPNSVSSSENSDAGDAFSRSVGTKRKSNSGSKRRIRRKRITPPPAVVTLPLLPETPDPKNPPEAMSRNNSPVWMSFENNGYATTAGKVDLPPALGSVVTVECVTDTWQEEKEVLPVKNLVEDTCPGFVSDGYGRVTWTNGAYREIVGEGGVWLVTKEVRVPFPCVRGFTCRVRVQDTCGKERTVPCDVWRMESGGFAWRLDVTAALSLSLAL
ncbi:uncharacterized protein LOC130731921 [Lotus japonicus]|uniref:uncharacterized protein LOC130731921 n=1 Tax=Lotus japonicus TaxID=34305 RepID=UPI00258684AD|nr:uncharacterized protein LOC130731921 [Lotus japonicus]